MQKNPVLTPKRLFTLLLCFASLVTFGQNCSPGFQSADNLDSMNFSSSTEYGAKLYSVACQSCHGPIEMSQKLGRTVAQINSARNSVPEMMANSKIRYLSASQIEAIAMALNPPAGGPRFRCIDENSRGLTADRMRRLTTTELRNTLKALLGTAIFSDQSIQTKLAALPADQIQINMTEFVEAPSTFLANTLFEISQRVVALMNANPNDKANILGLAQCSGNIDAACLQKVLQGFGRRVLRRDLTTVEQNDYVAFFQNIGGGATGLDLVVIRLLNNPSLVFHIEEGTDTINSGRVRLSNYEVASRISYMIAGTMPDDALLDAARNNQLQTVEAVRSQVQRYLAKPETKTKALDFFRFYGRLNIVPNVDSAPATNIGVSTANLGSEMQRESNDFIEYVLWQTTGTFKDLMTSTASFPRSTGMARILETSQISTASPVSQSPTHVGFLHRPFVIAASGERTRPIVRGAHLRTTFLCDELGAPPPEAVAEREGELGNIEDMPNRDKVSLLTSANACVGCHGMINPLGFAFEGYDQLGARRSVESIFDSSGSVTKTFPINTRITDPLIDVGTPNAFDSSEDMVRVIANSSKARACYAKRAYEYYTMRVPDLKLDGCALAAAETATSTKSLQDVLVDTVANEDIFWRKQP